MYHLHHRLQEVPGATDEAAECSPHEDIKACQSISKHTQSSGRKDDTKMSKLEFHGVKGVRS